MFPKSNSSDSVQCTKVPYFCKPTNCEYLNVACSMCNFCLICLDSGFFTIPASGTEVSSTRLFCLPNPVPLRMLPSLPSSLRTFTCVTKLTVIVSSNSAWRPNSRPPSRLEDTASRVRIIPSAWASTITTKHVCRLVNIGRRHH